MSDEFAKPLPQDRECERMVIGGLMAWGDDLLARERVIRILGDDASVFASPDHAGVYRAVLRLHGRGGAFGSLEVSAELRSTGVLEECGGAATLLETMDIGRLQSGSLISSARVVAERNRRRKAFMVGHRLRSEMQENCDEEAADAKIQSAVNELLALRRCEEPIEVIDSADAAQAAIDESCKPVTQSLATGFKGLDSFVTLFSAGYTVLAARPSMGKSMLAKNILQRQSRAGIPVGLIAVEEGRVKIGGNLLANNANIDNESFPRRKLTDEQKKISAEWVQVMRREQFKIVDRRAELQDIVDAFDLLAIQHSCQVIAVDHLHLIHNKCCRGDNREQEISSISAALKEACTRNRVSALVVAQLNRGLEVRDNKIPTMADLRGSGAIEEHADVIMFIHRDDYYHRNDPPSSGYVNDNKAQVIISKNRNGSTGATVLRADPVYQRFEDWTDDTPY